jgi:hypothetical protein
MRYQYTTIKSNRRTTSVTVTPMNEIIVKCPLNASKYSIEKFLDDRKYWLYNILEENAKKLLAESDVVEYKKIYIYGKKFPLNFGSKNKISDSEVCVLSKKDIAKTYKKYLGEEFIKEAWSVAAEVGITPTSFNIKSYKGRWGCCDRKGNITLNFLLMMLPYELRHYVIVHELCHMHHFNHSTAFWNEVKKYVPDYKEQKLHIKHFSFLIDLYT